MRRLIVLGTVLATLGLAGGALAAPATPAERGMTLCERQGGTPSSSSPLNFVCSKPTGFTDSQVSQGFKLCDRLAKKASGRGLGSLEIGGVTVQYSCTIFS
jgi:hypothetical protein